MASTNYEENLNDPFLMPIDDIFAIEGRGWVAGGLIARGNVLQGDLVEIVGCQENNVRVTVRSVHIYGHGFGPDKRPYTGEYANVMIRDDKPEHVQPGMVLSAPDTMRACKRFLADIVMIEKGWGGREQPIGTGYEPRLFLYNVPYHCTLTLPDDTKEAVAGDRLKLTVDTDLLIALEEGTQFLLKERHKTIAIGIVSELLIASIGDDEQLYRNRG